MLAKSLRFVFILFAALVWGQAANQPADLQTLPALTQLRIYIPTM